MLSFPRFFINRSMRSWIALLLLSSACTGLNYPEQPRPEQADAADLAATANNGDPGISQASPEPAPPPTEPLEDQTAEEVPRSWSALSRSAREARQAGRFDEAEEALEQAAMQLSMRPGSDAARRAIHGMRARLALELLARGRNEAGEPLADALLAEAEAEPALGGAATIDLATEIVDLRAREARRDGLEISNLPLMRIAMQSASAEKPSRSRLALAYSVAISAEREQDLDLAHTAIDLALSDARVLEPLKLGQHASLELARTRITIAQQDLSTAEQSLRSAERLLEEINADAGSLATLEAHSAHLAALNGDRDRAIAKSEAARTRLESAPQIITSTRRIVLGELARAARAMNDRESSQGLYREALDLPAAETAWEADLEARLATELTDLEADQEATRIPVPVEVDGQDGVAP
jgi:hypothetical protein